ncbi:MULTISPECIES: class I SAM-dependent methyltransferase [unclassified Streptomyces]|uniref:class I SAM-dependent methyltransferase n=1 Tax=unclassified Streptomyces TaxID=2593676 RepID=UPI002DD8E7A0|nr:MULTISPECIES: class I SAM-dependent methyltransferase [unclassified Streptomyces]WSA90406.1 class I SAM-dependent methyltransferase [Streptomyces sp. NBC_01795]WSB74633.1 class I SAM-dependent methyltransferase [Streptomyces sp. NBC_01775]WSS16984.1 class I SAM-dependent methyltransferase [Streptomyces sp. NBC_01186]WSS45727.1 class I SAM-dependent methyltransferase [Streptomyces sp. NBC_01187]
MNTQNCSFHTPATDDSHATSWTDEAVATSYATISGSTDWALGYPFVFRALGLERLDGGTLLDYGSGPGAVADLVARRYGVRVLAADISEAMLEKSRARANPALDHHLISDDRLALLPDGCADRAMCNFVLVCVPSQERLAQIFAEVYRLLRPGGTFTVLNPDHARVGVEFDCFELGEPGVEYEPGDPFPVRLKQQDGSWFSITDVFWPGEVYEELLRKAGFSSVRCEAPVLADAHGVADPSLLASRPWKPEQSTPPFLLFTAVK